jgi:hypothetical protein
MPSSLQLFTNNASSVLKRSLSSTDASMEVIDASAFPVLTASTYFKVTLDTGVSQEIVEVNARFGQRIRRYHCKILPGRHPS